MSLHKFAEQVAANGRGDDSLLVHMTPDEVRKLQQFAEANGTTLTINPTTGLPEAGMLSDLFKTIAPIALGAFLGPAGLGLSSMMAGVATGGITALATGSLSRGLMAGLGAYGGAGLGESFMTAGGGMSAANAATTAQQQLSGANLALGEAMPAQAAEQFTKDAVSRMTPSGAVSAGFNKAIASPTAAMDFAKQNFGNLAYAAAPIMAGAMVPTTTKVPEPKDTGYIRQFDYNINPETGRPDPLYGMRAMTPVKASEFGNKTFQGQRDLFRQQNPNPYQNPYELGVGSLNQPPLQQPLRMNTGGIVALANGGSPTVMADNDLFTQTDDSLDAYNFLIGRGKNLTQRTATADRPVMRRYDEDVLGKKAVPRATPVTGNTVTINGVEYNLTDPTNPPPADNTGTWEWNGVGRRWVKQTTTAGANTYRNVGATTYQNAGGGDPVTNPFSALTPAEQAAFYNVNPPFAAATRGMQTVFNPSIFGMIQNALVPGFQAQQNVGTYGFVPSNFVDPGLAVAADAAAVAQENSNVAAGLAVADDAAEAAAEAAAAAAVGPVGNAPGAPGGGGGGDGDGGGGGPGGGGGCVDPAVLITLADGSCVPAGSIKVGDVIFAMHEKTLEFGAYPVEYVEELDQPKALVLFDDGSSMLVSHSHKFFMIGGEWKQVYQLEPGDTVKAAPGATDKTVIELDPKGDGPVMKFTVTDAHTYISEGLISHNSKAKGGVVRYMAQGGMFPGYAIGGGLGSLGSYSDGGRLLKGPGDGVSDSIPATIGRKQQPARLADGEFVIPARIVSELGNGSTDAGAKKLYAMMDRVQRARGKTTGKNKVAANSRSDKYLPA